MMSTIKLDLERQWTWGCAPSYTAVARVAQLPNVKLAQQPNVANSQLIPLFSSGSSRSSESAVSCQSNRLQWQAIQ